MIPVRCAKYKVPRLFVGLVFILVALGCSSQDEVVARYLECQDLMADRAAVDKAFQCFDSRGRKLLTALAEERKKTAGKLQYLKRLKRLLQLGEPRGDVDFYDDLAVLTVSKRRAQDTIIFRKEDGEWRIDLLELRSFWRELDQVAK
jgi:hypothetical protein